MKRIDPHRRPQYTMVERMAILELRAMRGWNKTETGRRFFISDDTIRAWLRCVDDDSLVQTRTPVNRFPDFVRYAVQQIKLFCPTLGKAKIADTLARASIHIGKQDAFIEMLKQCRRHCPDLIVIDHRLNLGHGLPYVTAKLWGGEAYIDVWRSNGQAATRNRACTVELGIPVDEMAGVECIRSILEGPGQAGLEWNLHHR